MDRTTQLFCQRLVHQHVTLDPGLALKSLRDDGYFKMRFARLGCAGMSSVPGGVICDIQPGRRKRFV